MAAVNKYEVNNLALVIRRGALDLAIFIYIDAYKTILPSASIEEISASFLKHYKISEDELSRDSIKKSYYRTRDGINEEDKIRQGKNIFCL